MMAACALASERACGACSIVVSAALDLTGVDDRQLAERIQSAPVGGALQLESELYQRLARRLRLYGLRHLRDAELADDLVQQTMEIVIRKLRAREVENPAHIASFALGCARRCAAALRRKTEREALVEEPTPPDSQVAPWASPKSRAPLFRATELAAGMASLSERERAILTLSFYAEQSTSEIALSLGLTTGNVRIIRHRALERLRQYFGLEGDTP